MAVMDDLATSCEGDVTRARDAACPDCRGRIELDVYVDDDGPQVCGAWCPACGWESP